ncbi:GntR family transcriptional regulator [Nocardioides sp. Root140]|uniref:GntR family transcriptional regulator n=1 Tax=Nocardioides sp. Root140 TaxID=1736460 RepID=UPI0006FF4763|nr:FCD domain-containing protein [Nocardioides sp. Root140]KQY56522.1 GntR family transcriptional regulator [Nocardioides sp. Root140]
MTQEKTRANTEAVHALLRADVLGGVHQPGERLKFASLCERYGASVSVIREALTRLVEQGLVESEPKIGFKVRSVSIDDLRDLTATRIDIETIALAYAIERGGVDWEADMVGAHHKLERTPMLTTDGPPRISDEWEDAHGRFHIALLDGCGSPRLLDIACSLRDAAEFYRRWSQTRDTGRDVACEHREILEATLARDSETAVERLRQHYQRTAEILETALTA